MLSRVYVDNYGTLVNFELKLGREQLLIGRNGSGKTMLLDAVDAVVRFARGESTIGVLFPPSTKTRWDSRPEQTFELELSLASREIARYRLVVQHADDGRLGVREERVLLGHQPLFSSYEGTGRLYQDDGAHGPNVLTDWTRSSLPAVREHPSNEKLSKVKRALARIRIASVDPRRMSAVSEREEAAPQRDLSNLASWYRHFSQEEPDRAEAVRDLLRSILDGFQSLRLATEGSGRRMVTQWKGGEGPEARSLDFALDELSDGQRVLLGLAALAAGPDSQETTLLLDEPDNFVALPEVQPLLMAMRSRKGLQLIVISHHPEIINLQAREHGLVFERERLGPTRIRPFAADPDSTLTPAEIVARGEE